MNKEFWMLLFIVLQLCCYWTIARIARNKNRIAFNKFIIPIVPILPLIAVYLEMKPVPDSNSEVVADIEMKPVPASDSEIDELLYVNIGGKYEEEDKAKKKINDLAKSSISAIYRQCSQNDHKVLAGPFKNEKEAKSFIYELHGLDPKFCPEYCFSQKETDVCR